MKEVFDYLREVNWQTLLGFVAAWWYFTKNTNHKLDELKEGIKETNEKIIDIDRRLCRLEGAFASKDCCLLKEERHIRKVESV